MRFLVTGFEPFGALPQNASWEAVRRLPNSLGDDLVYTGLIPVEYERCARVLFNLADRLQPDAILCVGLAAGRDAISLEQVAVNVRASAAKDNAGVQFNGEKIDPDGPESFSSTIRMKELAAFLQEQDVPARISYSAGSFVCNDLYYRLLRFVRTEAPTMPAGFIHVPPSEEDKPYLRGDIPVIPTAVVSRALERIVAAVGSGKFMQ